MEKLIISQEFSQTPGGRHRKDGKYSGEEFLDSLLEPSFLKAMELGHKLLIDFDGGYGYPISFLDESFGGLAKKYTSKKVLQVLDFKSEDEPDLVQKVRNYILEANQEKRV